MIDLLFGIPYEPRYCTALWGLVHSMKTLSCNRCDPGASFFFTAGLVGSADTHAWHTTEKRHVRVFPSLVVRGRFSYPGPGGRGCDSEGGFPREPTATPSGPDVLVSWVSGLQRCTPALAKAGLSFLGLGVNKVPVPEWTFWGSTHEVAPIFF